MLRDALTAVPGFASWPCDEINAIWRHGNADWPDDALPASRATARVRGFIRGRFVARWKRAGRPDFLVEKTCANCLRIPFVDAVLPEAVFIHIHRNRADVVASAVRRWSGGFEGSLAPYLLAKARQTPVADLPRATWRFFRSRTRHPGAPRRLAWWGPLIPGAPALHGLSTEEICRLQWAACEMAARRDLAALPAGRRTDTSYEHLCSAPEYAIGRILHFLRQPAPATLVLAASAGIRPLRPRAPRPVLAPHA